MSTYPWTPMLFVVLILLAISISRVFRRSRLIEPGLAIHEHYHTGPNAPDFPEFCKHCREELSC